MKKRILSVLSLCLVFVMLCAAMFTFAGCGKKDKGGDDAMLEDGELPGGLGGLGAAGNGGSTSGVNGSYTDEDGIETITLKNGKWSVAVAGITLEGTYDVDGDNITFKMDVNGNDMTVYTGTVDGNKLTLKIIATGQTAVYYKN